MGKNKNLGSKALQNVQRRCLSAGKNPNNMVSIFPDVYFRIGKRHYILDAWEYAPNMKVYLEALHDIVNVESDAKRGGA